jgi:hypothetical protein
MLKILNENYYLDIDQLDSYVNIVSATGDTDNHVSVVKYEMIKTMIEVVLSESDEIDETLGHKSSDLSLPFKLAFNTLLNKKIINKY